ncbi:MAG: SH3 domain-containing protein [Synergistaceae bacterium]|nr:SH3 domain-containing protein [Synergistaceae bacterium]
MRFLITKNIFPAFIITAFMITGLTGEATAAGIADLDRFPQNGGAYLPADPDRAVTDPAEQSVYADEYKTRFFAPWRNADLSYLDISLDKIIEFQKNTAKKKFFVEGGRVLTKDSMTKIAANVPEAVEMGEPRPGVCLAEADVRVLPTSTPLFSSPESALGARGLLKTDWIQNSTVKPGEPLSVIAASKDGKWLLAATGTVVGWIKSGKAALVNDEFMERFMYASYSVFVKDNVAIKGKDGAVIAIAKMGTLLPVEGRDLLVPVKGKDGWARIMPYRPADGETEPFPVPFTPRNAVRAMDQLIGEPYGWGGERGLRDCSSMTRDYFTLFGVWLPRNSGDQANAGPGIILKGAESGGKLDTIVRDAVPFATLIHMPGHIMLYIGIYDGEPVVMHNVWGVRINAPGGKTGRKVIGKTVVSSLRAGAEIENRPKSGLYIDRAEKIVFPIGSTGR